MRLEDGRRCDHAHAFATAARYRFKQDGIADFARYAFRIGEAFEGNAHSRNHGNAGAVCELPSGGFGAKLLHGRRVGPTKIIPASAQARGSAGFSERKP